MFGGGTNFGQSLCLHWIHIIQEFYLNIGKGGKDKKIGTISHLKCCLGVGFVHILLGFPEGLNYFLPSTSLQQRRSLCGICLIHRNCCYFVF